MSTIENLLTQYRSTKLGLFDRRLDRGVQQAYIRTMDTVISDLEKAGELIVEDAGSLITRRRVAQ